MFRAGAFFSRTFQYPAGMESSRHHWRALSFGTRRSAAIVALPHFSTISLKLFIKGIMGHYPKTVKGLNPDA